MMFGELECAGNSGKNFPVRLVDSTRKKKPTMAKRPLISSASLEKRAVPLRGVPRKMGTAVATISVRKVRAIGIGADLIWEKTFWPEYSSAPMAATMPSIASLLFATSGTAPVNLQNMNRCQHSRPQLGQCDDPTRQQYRTNETETEARRIEPGQNFAYLKASPKLNAPTDLSGLSDFDLSTSLRSPRPTSRSETGIPPSGIVPLTGASIFCTSTTSCWMLIVGTASALISTCLLCTRSYRIRVVPRGGLGGTICSTYSNTGAAVCSP